MSLGMLGKYERLDVLGHGASSIVYLARDTLLRRTVAIKEISASGEEKSRVLEEARVLDRLRHPNIVRVNSVDTIGSKVIIDMEYVEGRDLQTILREADGPLPLDQALHIGVQICDGLAFAHARQTVHRDIKPANILITADGIVKLVDFGLAEVLGTNAYAGGAGTYAYMAPEDFGEESRSDAQSDLWAVGVILYEMITGRRPFSVARPKDPFAWKRALGSDLMFPPSHWSQLAPPELDRVIMKALARDKEDRYQSAHALSADLRRIASDTEDPATPHEPPVVVSRDDEPAEDDEPPLLLGAADIDRFLQVAPDRWDEASEALMSGSLTAWLEALGEAPLARVASTTVARNDDDPDAALREFLYRAGLDTTALARREANIGSRLLRAGAYREAAELLQKAVRFDPAHASYFMLLSKAHAALGETTQAIDTLKLGSQHHPRHGALLRQLKQRGGAKAAVSHAAIDFGYMRHGETRIFRTSLRNVGEGLLQGRVASLPGWIQITPMTFTTRHRQPINVVADSAHLLDGPGQYNDQVVFETTGGRTEIKVTTRVLPARLPFGHVAPWYIPLMALSLLPVIIGLMDSLRSSGPAGHLPFYIPGLIASGLFSASFIGLNVSADTGWLERLVPGVGLLLAPLGIVLFVHVMGSGATVSGIGPAVVQSALPAVALIALQGLGMYRAPDTWGRWQFWAWILGAVSAAICWVLWNAPR